MHEKQITGRGYCPIEFLPSEEAVLRALNDNGKCFIHYHLIKGSQHTDLESEVVTKKWLNSQGAITGPILYNELRHKQFVRNHHDYLEMIVVSIHENPEE